MINIPQNQQEFEARYETLPCKQKLSLKLLLLGFSDLESARLNFIFYTEEIALILISLCQEEIALLFNQMSQEQRQQIEKRLHNPEIIRRLHNLRKEIDPEVLKKVKQRVRQNIHYSGKHFGFNNSDKREKLVALFWKYKSELVSSSRLTEYGLNFLPFIRNIPMEQRYIKNILELGSLVRIRSPRLMGKTCLLTNILKQLKSYNQYKIVYFSFKHCDSSVLCDYKNLMQYFLASLLKKLNLEQKLIEKWENVLPPNENITILFEEFLSVFTEDLIIVLDDLDIVFRQPYDQDFCGTLRDFFNNSRSPENHKYQLWKKLHLILSHSTEIYATLNKNNSPLANVGTIIAIQTFNSQEIKELSKQYDLTLKEKEIEALSSLIGGHPYLVTLTFKYLKNYPEATLENIIESSKHKQKIYANHLQGLLGIVKQSQELVQAYGRILRATNPIKLDPIITWKLYGLGLTKMDESMSSSYCFCDLYYQYFKENL
ncbi:MAG: AAA-like domain-containing protein [Crocosphaera sp.]|nr:AAA-like domain-containing protein [Crocosphaera sp.]